MTLFKRRPDVAFPAAAFVVVHDVEEVFQCLEQSRGCCNKIRASLLDVVRAILVG